MRVLVVVGSIMFADRHAFRRAEDLIMHEISSFAPDACASGGAKGIDTLFRSVAKNFGYDMVRSLRPPHWEQFEIERGYFYEFLPREDIMSFPPGKPRWNAPGGYKDRNIKVATVSSKTCAIRCHTSATYGSGWTVDYAESIGRQVWREVL